MTKFSAILALLVCAVFFSAAARAQESSQESSHWLIQTLDQILPGHPAGQIEYDSTTGTAYYSQGIIVTNDGGALVADSARINAKTGDVQADGNVHLQSGDLMWVGEHIDYNFYTHRMTSEQFRAGKAPFFIGGSHLEGMAQMKTGTTNNLTATNVFFTTDDISNPAYRVHASSVSIVVSSNKIQTVKMRNAVMSVGGVPIFYFPYYERTVGQRMNHFTLTPGYRSQYGAELLATYSWFYGDVANGKIRANYYSKRGPGIGPDLNLHLGNWGDASLKYFYIYDNRPDTGTNNLPFFKEIASNRQRFHLDWQATPATNLNLKAVINYQSDPLIVHDFFPGEYTQDPQPNTFFEANKYWDNWSLDALTTPRVDSFYSQVERLPDVQLTGFRQQVFDSPIYYDSQSSIGEYRAYTANTTNNLFDPSQGFYTNSAARFDTYHQLTLPETFFDWLNVTPRVGGRFTYYSENANSAATQNDVNRGVFNTGVEFSFKASQLWSDVTNSFFHIDGLRHIIEPSANYVFVPNPNPSPATLPQFDGELPSLMLLPVDFPDYNSIDSVDAQNVIRFGLRNVLQTKRDGQLQDVVNWNMLLDWRLDPQANQTTLNDLYSDLTLRPFTWLAFDSQVRYDINDGNLNMAFHQITLSPNNRWSWGVGHWYLRGGAWGNGVWQRSDYLTSTFFYRMDDNWGVRFQHNFDINRGRLQSQFYTIYRDFRAWTAALTFRVEDDENNAVDYTVGFQLSLKASPSSHVDQDTIDPYHLVGE
ncbi:MAG TPA: hypothetical protein VGO57_00920 [Verrucomicrobiae bacterium]